MRFKQPRFYEGIFNNTMTNNYKGLKNHSQSPNALINDAYKN